MGELHMQAIQIHTIVSHKKLHIDEYWAIAMLKKWGEKQFPGIKDAKIDFDGTGNKNFDGINGNEFLGDGFLLIGIGGGMFDEHPSAERNGRKGECTSTLVARYLGIENEPALEKVMEFVRKSDLQAKSDPFDMASVVKAMHNVYTPEEVMDWAIKGLLAKYHQQESFLRAKKVYAAARVQEVPGANGKTIKVVTAITNETEFSKVARSNGAGIVIQQQTSGNVQIFTDKRLGLDIRDICQMIRIEEQYAQGGIRETLDWKELARPGTVLGADNWFFHEEAPALYNGSLTASDVRPTKIPLDVIQKIVGIGINPEAFEPSHQATCKTGICNSTRDNECPWYELGLQRCRKIRYEAKAKQQ